MAMGRGEWSQGEHAAGRQGGLVVCMNCMSSELLLTTGRLDPLHKASSNVGPAEGAVRLVSCLLLCCFACPDIKGLKIMQQRGAVRHTMGQTGAVRHSGLVVAGACDGGHMLRLAQAAQARYGSHQQPTFRGNRGLQSRAKAQKNQTHVLAQPQIPAAETHARSSGAAHIYIYRAREAEAQCAVNISIMQSQGLHGCVSTPINGFLLPLAAPSATIADTCFFPGTRAAWLHATSSSSVAAHHNALIVTSIETLAARSSSSTF